MIVRNALVLQLDIAILEGRGLCCGSGCVGRFFGGGDAMLTNVMKKCVLEYESKPYERSADELLER